jgi:hypothetical protein
MEDTYHACTQESSSFLAIGQEDTEAGGTHEEPWVDEPAMPSCWCPASHQGAQDVDCVGPYGGTGGGCCVGISIGAGADVLFDLPPIWHWLRRRTCWLGFGKGKFWEELELLSFNWARKGSIWDERNQFWRGIEREGVGFGAGLRGRVREREGGRRCRTGSTGRKVGSKTSRLIARYRLGTGGVGLFSRAESRAPAGFLSPFLSLPHHMFFLRGLDSAGRVGLIILALSWGRKCHIRCFVRCWNMFSDINKKN